MASRKRRTPGLSMIAKTVFERQGILMKLTLIIHFWFNVKFSAFLKSILTLMSFYFPFCFQKMFFTYFNNFVNFKRSSVRSHVVEKILCTLLDVEKLKLNLFYLVL